MVRFADKGKGYHGDPQGHSENARGIRHGYESKKQAELEYLRKKYYSSGRLSPREIRSLHKRRIKFARRYGQDAVTGIPRED